MAEPIPIHAFRPAAPPPATGGLDIATFDNASGGNFFYKAITHPLAAEPAAALIAALVGAPVAIYDPAGVAAGFASLHDLSPLTVAGVYAQKLEHVGRSVLGHVVRPVSELAAPRVLVLAFDADRIVAQVRPFLPEGAEVATLDRMRLPADMLTNKRRYLDPLNFATNFAFFRHAEDERSRLVTANYWSRYGAGEVSLWLRLFGGDGAPLATWRETVPPDAGIVVDSAQVAQRFGLQSFAGQLFIHAIGGAGHDVVKYALDTWTEGGASLSCTHDANAWPAARYAGLPAPRADEQVVIWLQNTHPRPIPAGAIALSPMGVPDAVALDRPVPAFATVPVDTRALLPQAAWPTQLELHAGKHVVRPRYEVVRAGGRRHIAHLNVERDDLKPDPGYRALGSLLGKGFILPGPILPRGRWRTTVLATPMSTAQAELPLRAAIYDPEGREVAARRLGCLPRAADMSLDVEVLLGNAELGDGGWGHLELTYDFAEGGDADGWLHAIFRYDDRATGHGAETSFGAHVFNTAVTWKSEPQSYSGPPPGLSTRLFLRLGGPPLSTLCHLIYPASLPWHPLSATDLQLHDGTGREIARQRIAIPCGGSRLWRADEMFDAAARAQAGERGYIIVRDETCRLFGYHGLDSGNGAFSLDHMFGF